MQRLNLHHHQEIRQLLRQWKGAILYRDKEKAEHFYTLVNNAMKKNSNTELFILHSLLTARHHLLHRKIDNAEIILDNLSKIIYDEKKPLILYYFHKFTALLAFLKLDFQEAQKSYHRAFLLRTSTDLSKMEEADLYFQLSLVAIKVHEVNQSINYAQKAIPLYSELNFFERMTDCYILMALAHKRVNDFEKAENYLLLSMQMAKDIDNVELIGRVLTNLGEFYAKSGDHDTAISFYKEGFEHKTGRGKTVTVYSILQELNKTNRTAEMAEWLEIGYELTKGHEDDPYTYHITYFYLQHSTTNAHLLEDFLKNKAIPFFQRIGDREQIHFYAEKLAETYIEKEDFIQATFYLKLSNKHLKEVAHFQ